MPGRKSQEDEIVELDVVTRQGIATVPSGNNNIGTKGDQKRPIDSLCQGSRGAIIYQRAALYSREGKCWIRIVSNNRFSNPLKQGTGTPHYYNHQKLDSVAFLGRVSTITR